MPGTLLLTIAPTAHREHPHELEGRCGELLQGSKMNFDLKKKGGDQSLKSVSLGVHPRFPNRRQTLRQDSLLIGKNIPGASYSLLALLSHL